MPQLEIEKIYKRPEDQEQYIRALQEMEKRKEVLEVLADLEVFLEHIDFPPRRAVPHWIRKWAEELEKAGARLKGGIEEARRISRKFKTPLSEEIIAEREERR